MATAAVARSQSPIASGAAMILRSDALKGSALLLAGGAFFAAYQEMRPLDILLTYSDLLFVLGGLLLVFEHGANLRPFGSLTPLWYISIGLLLGGLLLSSLFNGVIERWPIVAGQYFFAYVFLAVILMPRDPRRWRTLAAAFLAGIVVMEAATFAIYFYYDGNYAELTQRFSHRFVTGAGRIGSFVGNPNYHAALIACTLPFLFYFTARRWMPRWVAAACLLVLVAALLYTASNTGLGAAVIVGVIFLVAGRIRLRPAYFAAAAAAALVYIGSGAPLPRAFEARVAPALASGNIEEAGTFLGRADLIKEAWDLADSTLILGVGVDQYREVSRDRMPVHNSFLLLWTEGGLAALTGWLGVIGVLALCSMAALQVRPLDAALGLSVLAVFCIFSIASPHMYARIWMVPVLLAVGATLVGPAARPVRADRQGVAF
ncbi:MAG TPA: hypothetical protein DDZ68_14280 [Parvularcula sp.]|nr:hypothetical protein [Parvularcula sp.]